MVHGDAWPGNAAQSGPDTVTLIDWETGGLGLPVLDLGHGLSESLLGTDPPVPGPGAWLVEPDEGRIAAVARGHAEHRLLGEAERALLPEAVRFGATLAGPCTARWPWPGECAVRLMDRGCAVRPWMRG